MSKPLVALLVRVPAEVKDRLHALAEATGNPVSYLVRDILLQYLEMQPAPVSIEDQQSATLTAAIHEPMPVRRRNLNTAPALNGNGSVSFANLLGGT